MGNNEFVLFLKILASVLLIFVVYEFITEVVLDCVKIINKALYNFLVFVEIVIYIYCGSILFVVFLNLIGL